MIGEPLTPEQQAMLDAFSREMETHVIPKIVAAMERRRQLAAEARNPLSRRVRALAAALERETTEGGAWRQHAQQAEALLCSWLYAVDYHRDTADIVAAVRAFLA